MESSFNSSTAIATDLYQIDFESHSIVQWIKQSIILSTGSFLALYIYSTPWIENQLK